MKVIVGVWETSLTVTCDLIAQQLVCSIIDYRKYSRILLEQSWNMTCLEPWDFDLQLPWAHLISDPGARDLESLRA